jgi:hypothetical protein
MITKVVPVTRPYAARLALQLCNEAVTYLWARVILRAFRFQFREIMTLPQRKTRT